MRCKIKKTCWASPSSVKPDFSMKSFRIFFRVNNSAVLRIILLVDSYKLDVINYVACFKIKILKDYLDMFTNFTKVNRGTRIMKEGEQIKKSIYVINITNICTPCIFKLWKIQNPHIRGFS